MKTHGAALAAAMALALTTGACSKPAEQATVDTASEAEAIRKVTEDIVEGFETRDMERIMSAYSPNEDLVVFDIAPPIKYVGAKALRGLNEHWLNTFEGTIEGDYKDFDVKVEGDIAYGSNTQHWKFTRKDGTVFEFNTRLMDVYRKIDGKWRVVMEHGSVPVDLATLKPVLDAE